MAFKPTRLQPGEMVTARAKADAGHHPVLGPIIKGQDYTVDAAHFPLELLERPAGVLFPFEPETAEPEPTQAIIDKGGDV